jgi:hypothetical protein
MLRRTGLVSAWLSIVWVLSAASAQVPTVGAGDFGDAPDTYGTLLASNGPHHTELAGFSLGPTIDSEIDGQPNAGATGDGADEDGVTLPAGGFVACSVVNVSVTITNTAGIATPIVDAWIDFDGDGAFGDPRDRVVALLALGPGTHSVPVNVPCDAGAAASYARFRLSAGGVVGPGGPGPFGEVEDYATTVVAADPVIGVAKELSDSELVGPATHQVTFVIRIENLGNVPLSDLSVADDLAATFAAAVSFQIVTFFTDGLAVNPSFDGDSDTALLLPGQSLAVGAVSTITLVVEVVPGDELGPYSNVATASGTSPADVTVNDSSQDGADPDPDQDGDPTNDSDPTLVTFEAAVEVPALGTWALIGLVAALAALGAWWSRAARG